MTRKCLSKRISISSDNVFKNKDMTFPISSYSLSVFQNKTYKFKIHIRKDSGISIAGHTAVVLKWGLGGNG